MIPPIILSRVAGHECPDLHASPTVVSHRVVASGPAWQRLDATIQLKCPHADVLAAVTIKRLLLWSKGTREEAVPVYYRPDLMLALLPPSGTEPESARPARCYGVVSEGQGWYTVFSEQACSSTPWSVEQLFRAALLCGHLNAYFSRTTRPSLDHGLRRFRATPRNMVDRLRQLGHLSADTAEAMWRLQASLRAVCPSVSGLRTFCHNDVSRHHASLGSLTSPLVLGDWGLASVGTAGEDLGPLLGEYLLDAAADLSDVGWVEEELVRYYCEGLADQGVHVDADAIRMGHSIGVANWLIRRSADLLATVETTAERPDPLEIRLPPVVERLARGAVQQTLWKVPT